MGATERIIAELVPEWIEHQRNKSKDYNTGPGELNRQFGGPEYLFENADVLGVPGQFAEIWRKVWKLKKGMWDGADLVGEQPREILLDFIGHCFLAIDMIDREQQDTAVTVNEANIAGSGVFDDAPARTDRGRLRQLVGHGYDKCPACERGIHLIEVELGRSFDWEQDIP